MFIFLRRMQRTLQFHKGFGFINSKNQQGFVQNTIFIVRLLSSSSLVENRSIEAKGNEQEQSFTVSYFMNSCGLSSKSAFSASRKVSMKNVDTADSVLRLLRNNGFTNTQISKVVRVFPNIIDLDSERILLPKIEFFRSIGVSSDDLPKLIASTPHLLAGSLKNTLTPNYHFLQSIVILDGLVIKVLKRMKRAFLRDLRNYIVPNIAILKEIGVPPPLISNFVITAPCTICCKPPNFSKLANEVKEMGFNPLQMLFLLAIQVISQLTKANWESKIEVYRRWGWSKDETLVAFKKHPFCMSLSEEKITKTMDFFVNKMLWLSQDIAKRPEILLCSLEKRIVPRCSVIQILLSKGLIKKDFCLSSFLVHGERKFLERYVIKYQLEVPQLLDLYKGNMNLLDVQPAS